MSIPSNRLLRLLAVLGAGVLFVWLLGSVLFLARQALEVWERLAQGPTWLLVLVVAVMLSISLAMGAFTWWLLRPRRPRVAKPQEAEAEPAPPPSREEIVERVESAAEAGVDVAEVQRELRALEERKATGILYVSLFGEISAGKSSLIRALLPEAQPEVSPRGGTTREIEEYRWRTPAGDELVLTDVPGTNAVDEALDALSRAEAQRAHIVIYVCDGDLTRTQYCELLALLALGKPCILAINKADRFRPEELELLRERIRERLAGWPHLEIVSVQAGGELEAVRVLPDGRQERVRRPIPPRVEALEAALQRLLDQDQALLESLRDGAVFRIAAHHLAEAETQHRREAARRITADHARKAVVGAVAAVAPGSDLVIQGYLGVSLVKSLSELYKVPIRKADRERFLALVKEYAGTRRTLVLAVAGNALKAFPGAGTLAGGALHAVAYGLVFQALGRALAQSLESRGELRPLPAALSFKETLGEDLEDSARRLAQLALEYARDKGAADGQRAAGGG